MRRFLIVAAGLPVAVCSPAFAQAAAVTTMPSLGITSPLGIGAGRRSAPTGIPMGSTEIASPGVSPAPTGTTGAIAIPSSGTTCSTLGTSSSGMFGSTSTFDGGGTAMGATSPATAAMSGTAGTSMSSGISSSSAISATSGMLDTSGLSGMCGSGSSSVTASSTPTSTSPTTPGGSARTGIPMGSTEIGNLGVSSAAAVPTINVLPTVGSAPLVPILPTVSSPSTASSTTTSTGCSSSGTTAGTSQILPTTVTPGGC